MSGVPPLFSGIGSLYDSTSCGGACWDAVSAGAFAKRVYVVGRQWVWIEEVANDDIL